MLKLKESSLCRLCKSSLNNDNNSCNIILVKNRKSIVTEAVSLMFEKLIHISPQILRSSSLSTLTSMSTCDNCLTNLNQLIQLYKVLQETEIKIQQKFQWISQLIFQKEHDTPQITEDEVQDQEHYLVVDEIKEELTDGDLDLYQLGFDGSISPLLSPVLTPLNLNADDYHNDHSKGTLETKVRNCRKRRDDVNQNDKAMAIKSKRHRKSQNQDKSQNHQPEVFNVHIQKRYQTRNNQASLEDSYVFQLYDDSITTTTHYTNKSECHKNTTELPELMIVLQDFVNLIPSQVKKCLDPLEDCRFSVQQNGILPTPGGQGDAVVMPLPLEDDGGRVGQIQPRDAVIEVEESEAIPDADEDLIANFSDGDISEHSDYNLEEEYDHSKTKKKTKTSTRSSRAPNFTNEEVSTLVDLYANHSKILQGQLQGFDSVRRRKWKEILDGVNAVGSNNRTIHQIRKKVKNLKHSSKKSVGKTLTGSDDDDVPYFTMDKMPSDGDQGHVDPIQRLDADLEAEPDDIADNRKDFFVNSSDGNGSEGGDCNLDEENAPLKTEMKAKTSASSCKAPMFTDEEVSVLVDLYAKNSRILHGSAGARVKKRKWKEILDVVNAMGSNNRSLHQIKNKIKNLQQYAKLKAVRSKKSFGKTDGCTNDDAAPACTDKKIGPDPLVDCGFSVQQDEILTPGEQCSVRVAIKNKVLPFQDDRGRVDQIQYLDVDIEAEADDIADANFIPNSSDGDVNGDSDCNFDDENSHSKTKMKTRKTTTRSRRSPNFTDEEESILVDLYKKHSIILQRQLQDSADASVKKLKWKEILDGVNAVGSNNRTLHQIKKKVKNLKHTVKSIAVRNKNSFGETLEGSDNDDAPDFTNEKMLSTISKRHTIDQLQKKVINLKLLKKRKHSQFSVHKIPELHFTSLSSLTVVNGKKYFLHYEFQEDYDNHTITCGYPDCNFTTLTINKLDDSSYDGPMMDHIRQIHLKDPTPELFPITCSTCGHPFTSRRSMYDHKWLHYNKSEQQALLSQGFTLPKNARNRIRTYKCPHCPKIFPFKQGMLAHIITHTARSDRPKFICDICGTEMTTERGIHLHRLKHDPDALIGKWKHCTICPKKFLVKTHLQNHIIRCHRTYEDRNFVCEKCGLKFPTKDDLTRHYPSHNPKDWRPFKCHMCTEAYRFKHNLKRHIIASHGPESASTETNPLRQYNQIKPVQGCKQMFPCDWCDQLFELRSRRWKHVQKKHRKEVEIISREDVQHENSLQGDD